METPKLRNNTRTTGDSAYPDDLAKIWSSQDSGEVRAFLTLTHRFSVEEYTQLAEAGILLEDDRLELIDGRIIDMPPIGSHHASCVKRILATFVNLFQTRAIVSVQDPVRLGIYSEPQPDLMLLQQRDDFYAERHPVPDEVLLLVEVSDSSLEYDKAVKIPLYSQKYIQEVWLINLREHCVEMYRSPTPAGYESISVLRGNQTLTPQAFPDVTLTAVQVLEGKEEGKKLRD
jgi:Uma2 family endonuclease